MALTTGDLALNRHDGRTEVRLVRDITDQVEPALPKDQRYWVVEKTSGARRLAIVQKERVLCIRRRTGLDHGTRLLVDA